MPPKHYHSTSFHFCCYRSRFSLRRSCEFGWFVVQTRSKVHPKQLVTDASGVFDPPMPVKTKKPKNHFPFRRSYTIYASAWKDISIQRKRFANLRTIIWKIFFKIIGLANCLILSITVIWKIFRKITIITITLFTLEPMADTLLSSPAFQIKTTQDSL